MSEWQTPQCVISIWTSRSPGSRRENAKGANADVGLWTANPRISDIANSS
jgi:hypothetical protein